MENKTTILSPAALYQRLLPMIERTNLCIAYVREDMTEFEGEASYFVFRLEEPEVQTGNQVPLRPPEEILLELLWGQSFSAEVQETKGRPEGPSEEDLKRCFDIFA